MLDEVGWTSTKSVDSVLNRPPQPVEPVIVDDIAIVDPAVCRQIKVEYDGPAGVSSFIVRGNSHTRGDGKEHPLFALTQQLNGPLNFEYPLRHPLEEHPLTLEEFGGGDGTVKVRDVPKVSGYREQGETAEQFDTHHDGLGSGGAVETVVLYLDRAPLLGGYTYFQNLPLISLGLASTDYEAFITLFEPDAIDVMRPRGKGAIRVIGPALFLNEQGLPQSNFRSASGEYVIAWKQSPAMDRARRYLEAYARPFAYGSHFVHLTEPGHGCISRNRVAAHGRTSFVNHIDSGRVRVLSRKWYMTTSAHQEYKHVPGLTILRDFAHAYGDISSPDKLIGEWLYDPERGDNVRIH